MAKKQFAVIGLGRFGSSVARTLTDLGCDVLAIDQAEAAVQDVVNDVTHAVQADAREEETLRSLGIRNFDAVVVAIGDDIQANILITMMLKEIGVKNVIAKAVNTLHGKVLEKVGADKIIFPEKDMGVRLAHNMTTKNVLDFIELAPGYRVLEALLPSKYAGMTLGQLELRSRYGISVMAIKRRNDVILAPGADQVLEDKDVIVLVGKNESLLQMPE